MEKNELKELLEIITENRFYLINKIRKEDLCKQFAKYYCEENNINYIEFKIKNFNGEGEFKYKPIQITLNENLFENNENSIYHNGCKLLETIVHEYTHYNQYINYKDKKESEIYKELETPINEDPFYILQKTEQDANKNALRFLKDMYKIYQSNNLKNYIKELESQYKKRIKDSKKQLRKQNYAKTENEIIKCIDILRPYYKIANDHANNVNKI